MTQRHFTGLMTRTFGCTVDRYSCTFAGETKKRTFTTYEDSMGRIVAEIERIEGDETAQSTRRRWTAERATGTEQDTPLRI